MINIYLNVFDGIIRCPVFRGSDIPMSFYGSISFTLPGLYAVIGFLDTFYLYICRMFSYACSVVYLLGIASTVNILILST